MAVVTKILRASGNNSGLTRASNVVTVTLAAASTPNVKLGDSVVIAGCTPTSFNGTHTVTAVNSTTEYEFSQVGSDESTTVHGTSGGDYSVAATWESSEQNDLVSAGNSHVLECYDDWSSGLAGALDISGWVTGSSNTITVRAASGHETNGRVPTSADHAGFHITSSDTGGVDTITLGNSYTYLQDIAASRTSGGTGARTIHSIGTDYTYIDRCTLEGTSATVYAVYISASHSNSETEFTYGHIRNCVIFSRNLTGVALGLSSGLLAQSCTVVSLGGTSTAAGISNLTDSHGMKITNCVVFRFSGGAINSTTMVGSHNATDNSTISGTNGVTNITTAAFADAANNDYRLSQGSALYNTGTDLSGTFTDDFRGATRVASSWDIGAFKLDQVLKTLKTSLGDYSSIITWESSEQSDLVASGEFHVLECYTGTYSNAAGVSVSGWTTSATNNITIKAAAGSEHGGDWTSGVKLVATGTWIGAVVHIDQTGTTVEGLIVESTGSPGSNVGFRPYACIRLKNCMVAGTTGSTANCHGFEDNSSDDSCEYINCVAKDCKNDGFRVTNFDYSRHYNCTAVDNGGYGFVREGSGGQSPIAKNCVAYNNTLGDFGNTGSVVWDTTNSVNNASGDTSVSTLSLGTVTGITSADFNAYASNDFSPASGSDLIDTGTSLSGIFTDDITGTTRSGTWDIGAYEYVSVGYSHDVLGVQGAANVTGVLLANIANVVGVS